MAPKPTTFGDRVYDTARKIPKGKVATYGQIAKLAGKPGAARAVGTYMRKNSGPKNCPCHRVVGAGGSLTGYAFGGVSHKRKILIEEGVSFKGAKVNLETSQWKVK